MRVIRNTIVEARCDFGWVAATRLAPARRLRPGLGTLVEVGAFGSGIEPAIEAAFAAIALAEARWSFHRPSSELSQLNARPGVWVPLSRPTTRLLRLARALARASGHRFDCTVGGLLVAAGALPRHGDGALLARGDAGDIEVRLRHARLRRPVRLTLDGIAKGYAVDLAVEALRTRGAYAGWVNAGGDLSVFGDFALPLHRRAADGRLEALGALRDAAVATSAVTGAARAHRQQRQRFPACLVGPAGPHAAPGVWTVLARRAWRADALTKVAAAWPSAQAGARVAALGGRLVEPPR
jgi:thiamine biosynthesis lipoprotein